MPFVKLDTGILNSTLWLDRNCREIFITSLLMASPKEFTEPQEAISVRSLDKSGFVIPAGWYGFIEAAGIGIVNRALLPAEEGMDALERLCSIDTESRSPQFEGRRLARVDGGYIVLNYMKYRDKDHNVAERMRQYRNRLKSRAVTEPLRNDDTWLRNVTHTEAEAYTETEKSKEPSDKNGASLNCELDRHSAAKGLGEMVGMSSQGYNLHMLLSAIDQGRRRWSELRNEEIAEKIAALWREYVGQPTHVKVSIKNFMDTVGRYIDSDDWRVKPKESVTPKNGTPSAVDLVKEIRDKRAKAMAEGKQ